MNGRPIKHLLIDLDGTLIEHGRNFKWKFILDCIKIMGKSLSYYKIVYLMINAEKILTHPKGNSTGKTNIKRLLNFISDELAWSFEDCELFYRKTLELAFKKSGHAFKEIPGAGSFIDWARKDFNLILATNPVWPKDIVLYRLKACGPVEKNFSYITNSENMHSTKPYVSYYQQIINDLKLRPEECLMIGNDYRKDGPALKLGIRTAIYDPKANCGSLDIQFKKQKNLFYFKEYVGLMNYLMDWNSKSYRMIL